MRKLLEFINVMRVIGTVLITNSHFERIWPISALATGGTLGNVIFFLVAGYCYSPKEKNVFSHICVKFVKLYVPIFIIQFLCIVFQVYKFVTVKEMLKICVFPTNYWFFSCILVGYFFWYTILKHRVSILMVSGITLFVSTVAYIFGGDGVGTVYSFYLAVMGYGIYANQKNFVCSRIRLGYVCSFIVVFYVVKYYSTRYEIIGFLENIIALTAGMLFYLWISSKEDILKGIKSEKFHKAISVIASMTWQIYLVQVPILKKMVFPQWFLWRFLVACFSIFVCAAILKFVDLKLNAAIFVRK